MKHLERAIPAGAYLKGANLERVNLAGAFLPWVSLKGANLEGAIVSLEQLERASLNDKTVMPDGSYYHPTPPAPVSSETMSDDDNEGDEDD
jgi:hypothetical protein